MISNKLDFNERVVVIIRKHWLAFLAKLVILIVGALLPLVGVLFMPELSRAIFLSLASQEFWIFVYTLWLLLLWLLGFIAWTNYFLDLWIVTDRRIIDIDQRTLFHREITTLMLEKIQDVTIDTDGVFATLFSFGTLVVHTAGENRDITIHFARHPQGAKDAILAGQHGRSKMVSGL